MRSKVQKCFALLLAVSLLAGTVSGTAFAETGTGGLADDLKETSTAEASESDGGATEPGLKGVAPYWWADAVNDEDIPKKVFHDYDGSQKEEVIRYVADTYDRWDKRMQVTLEINKKDLDKVIDTDESGSVASKLEAMGLAIVDEGINKFGQESSYAYQSYIYYAGSRVNRFYEEFVDKGDFYSIKFSTASVPWFHTVEQEKELRRYVQALFSPGGELYAYRAENDLYSDYEKYTAIWEWIKKNISYGGTHSAWHGIVQGSTYCDGYSVANALLCAYAGVDSVPVGGYIPQGHHAWNWIRIGEKWFTSDSTGNYLTDRMFLRPSNEEVDSEYVLDESLEPPEIQAQYPRYTVEYEDALAAGNKIDSGRIGDNLIWTLNDNVLTISGSGEMRDFEDPYLVPWRGSTEYIEKVVIKDGVTSIGANAFYDLENIKKDDSSTADIAASVKEIGKHAFYDPDDPVTEFASRLEMKSNPTIKYQGAALTKEDVVQEGFYGNTAAESSDFKFRYSTDQGKTWTDGLPENVGTYTVEATLKEENINGTTYHSSTEITTVTIAKADFHVRSIEAKMGRIYDGTTEVHIQNVNADYSPWSNRRLKMGVDYEITAQYTSPNVGTGWAYMTVKPLDTVLMNNYNLTYEEGPVTTTYLIRAKTLTNDMFEPIPDQPYTGSEIRPFVTIASGEASIMTYDDFTVKYESNIQKGTGYVVLEGKNNYTGEVRLPFEIDDTLPVKPTLIPTNSAGVTMRFLTILRQSRYSFRMRTM